MQRLAVDKRTGQVMVIEYSSGGIVLEIGPYQPNGRPVYVGREGFLVEVDYSNCLTEWDPIRGIYRSSPEEIPLRSREGNSILFHPTLHELAEVKEFFPGSFFKVRDFDGSL